MKKNNILKIVFGALGSLFLFITLLIPFNSISVNAQGQNITNEKSGITYYQADYELVDVANATWLDNTYVPIGSLDVLLNDNEFYFDNVSTLDWVTDQVTYFYLNNDVYKNGYYGFYVEGLNDYFYGFRIYIPNLNDITSYDIDLVTLSFDSSRPTVNNSFTVYSKVNGEVVDQETFYFKSAGVTIDYLVVNNSSPYLFDQLLTNCLYMPSNEYYTFNSFWTNGSYAALKFIDLGLLANYFNITYDLPLLRTNYGSTISYEYSTNSIKGNSGPTLNYCLNGVIIESYITPIYTSNISYTINEINFIYNLFNINMYPNFPYINYVLLPELFTFDYNSLDYFYNGDFYLAVNFVDRDNILYSSIMINDGILSLYEESKYETINVYNIKTHTFLNSYYKDSLIFSPYYNTDDIAVFSTSTDYINRFNAIFEQLPLTQQINGWYTFDLEPQNNLIDDFVLELDVSFTSNSKGFNYIYISNYNDIMGTDGLSIIYANKDNNGNIIEQIEVYNYASNINNGAGTWLSVNYRQLFFDKDVINIESYELLETMGVFTFISNRVNDDATLRDVFWSIAEVPIITLRKAFDFELLGMNVTNFVVGLLSACIILYLLRKFIF